MSAEPPAQPRLPRPVRALLLGLLAGAAFGAAEMAVRIWAGLDPSIARRALFLVAYAALLTAPVGAILVLLLSLALRRWRAPARWLLSAPAAVLLLAFAAALVAGTVREEPAERPPPAPGAPDVLLVVVDTLRADAVGAYGAPGGGTPALDALAARGALFERVTTTSSWTLPSMASLLTATLPPEHGCVDFDRRLDQGLPGLAAAFAAAGYETRAVVGNSLLAADRGFAAGFHVYDVHDHVLEKRLLVNRALVALLRAAGKVGSEERSLVPWFSSRFPWIDTRLAHYTVDEDLNARVSRYADPRRIERPLFLYVHYLAPHTPYLEHPLSLGKRWFPNRTEHLDQLRARYAGEVAYVDGVLADLLRRFDEAGRLERAIVCVTSDHGEEFQEHGHWEHGYNLHGIGVRVPWILAGAGVPEGVRVGARVSQLHLAPTLLELAGVRPPAGFRASSLAGVLRGQAPAPDETIFCDATSKFLTKEELHYGALADGWKLLRRRGRDGDLIAEELYDLERDPGELEPLAVKDESGAALQAALDTYEAAARVRIEGGEPGEDVLDKMRALGYAGDG